MMMGFFSKAEYEELKVPFTLDIYTNPDEERKLGI